MIMESSLEAIASESAVHSCQESTQTERKSKTAGTMHFPESTRLEHSKIVSLRYNAVKYPYGNTGHHRYLGQRNKCEVDLYNRLERHGPDRSLGKKFGIPS
jgi:hypothetical protein